MHLTAAERIILHIAEHWRSTEPLEELTQKGIAKGSGVLRSHVPRNLKKLIADGHLEESEGRIGGRGRKVKFYRITEAGLRRAREIEEGLAKEKTTYQGKDTTIGEISRQFNLTPLHVLLRIDSSGQFLPPSIELVETPGLIEREEDMTYLRKWLREGGPVAVVYGSAGMGKTSLGKAFVSQVKRSVVWIDLKEMDSLETILEQLENSLGSTGPKTNRAKEIIERLNTEEALIVIDNYHVVPEQIVDFLGLMLSELKGGSSKVLVLAHENTPSYCRFYNRNSILDGDVWERHLKGLTLEGCKTLLGTEHIDDEALKCIFLLTKGTPLYLELIRRGDMKELQKRSRFTSSEVRLLIFSRDVVKQG